GSRGVLLIDVLALRPTAGANAPRLASSSNGRLDNSPHRARLRARCALRLGAGDGDIRATTRVERRASSLPRWRDGVDARGRNWRRRTVPGTPGHRATG